MLFKDCHPVSHCPVPNHVSLELIICGVNIREVKDALEETAQKEIKSDGTNQAST